MMKRESAVYGVEVDELPVSRGSEEEDIPGNSKSAKR